jgi:hypothetical protein
MRLNALVSFTKNQLLLKRNKMSVRFLTLLGVLFQTVILAQGFQPYAWETDRTRYTRSPAEQSMPELMVKNHFEYTYGFEADQFLMQMVNHRIVVVNNNEAIQKHNRIVVSMGDAIELIDVKARAINKDGKVVLFDKKNLKELKDEESGNAYRIFAIEGIELGSEIEYYFVRKMYPRLFDKVYMQTDVPIKNSSFILHSPKHLKFDFKSYHNFPKIKSESGDTENTYSASMSDVSGMKKEPFSYVDSNRKCIEFKLAYNTARSQARLYTWDEAAKNFYATVNNLEKDEEKALDKFVKTLKDNPSSPLQERIRHIENALKTTIKVNEESGDRALSSIEPITKYKVASKKGITRLMAGTFRRLNIPYQVVVSCSRKNAKFDESFDTWNYLDDYALYFPDTKGFLAPYELELRYPMIQPEFMAQKGLFIEGITIGDLTSGLGTIHEIPAIGYQYNTDKLDVRVDFSGDMTSNQLKSTQLLRGYSASSLSFYSNFMSEEQRRKMVEEYIKQTAPDPSIQAWSAKSVEDSIFTQFLIDVDFQSSHFIEKAGPRVLFKIGQLIGPQLEMYRDDERLTSVENDYNRGYDRTISVKIPAGYVVKNLQELNFNVVYTDGDATPFLFTSAYVLADNVLTVSIEEYYKQIFAPLSRYEDYRKVINAAADFNKVTLILEKIK